MARSTVFSRLSIINRLIETTSELEILSGKQFRSSVLSKPSLWCPFSSSPSPSVSDSVEKVSCASAAALKREYEKQKSVLRKKYAAELGEKQRREMKDEEEERARINELKAQRLILKKEKSTARAIEVEQENKILQDHLKDQRATSVTARNKLEARLGLIRHKRIAAIRRQSSMWIEEKDLERRILEAMANPYHLRGSKGTESIDRDDSYYEAEEA